MELLNYVRAKTPGCALSIVARSRVKHDLIEALDASISYRSGSHDSEVIVFDIERIFVG
jgi:hypothetical protein